MVDWGLARQIARFAARSDDVPDLGVDIAGGGARDRAARWSRTPGSTPAAPRAAGRGGRRARSGPRPTWRRSSVAARPGGRAAGGPLRRGRPVRGRAARRRRRDRWRPRSGLVTGYLSQRVLGQYELSLLGAATRRRGCCSWRPTSTARPPTSAWTARASCAGSRSTSWCTRSSSASVPWLRDHLGDLLREYLDTVDVRIDQRRRRRPALAAQPGDAGRARSARAALAALVQSGAQREHPGPRAGRDGGGRGPRRAPDGRARARAGARARGPARGHGRAAAPAARRPSGSSCACWAWT